MAQRQDRQPSQSKGGAPSSSKVKPEDLTCAVCLDNLKDPKLLPCLHSFCKGCLEGLVRRDSKPKRNQIVCPRCRSKHDVPINGAGGFPSDLVSTNTLAFQKDQKPKTESTKPVTCNACTEGDNATTHCPSCNKFLCEFCSKAHGRLLEYRQHKLVPLDEVDVKAVKAFERLRFCSQHRGEVLKLYCKTCDQLICRDCTIINHRDHSLGFTSVLRPQVDKEIQQMAKTLEAKHKEFQAHLEFLKLAEKRRGEYSKELQSKINAAFDSLIQLVENERQKFLRQEQDVKTADLKRIWEQKDFVEVTLANLASGLRYADRLCTCTNDQDMLAMSHKVRQHLSVIRTKTWAPEDSYQCSSLLTFTSTASGNELVKSVGTLNSVQPHEFTVSVRASGQDYGTSRQVNVELRKTVQFTVEVQSQTQSGAKLKHLVVPFVSVMCTQTGEYIKDAHTLVFKPRNNSWLLTIAPTYAGFFAVSVVVGEGGGASYPNYRGGSKSVGISVTGTPKPGDRVHRGFFGVSVAGGKGGRDSYPGYGGESNSVNISVTGTPKPGDRVRRGFFGVSVVGGKGGRDSYPGYGGGSNCVNISVTGTPKPGDRVRRGPHWQNDNEDGGVGSEGVVVKVDPANQSTVQEYDPYYYHSPRRHSPTTTVSVCWDNGKEANYTWSEQGQSIPIELVPHYMFAAK